MTRQRPRPPSQRDVAELAGVSRTTVSFVVNEAPGVTISPATRQRVWEAVEELGFQSNELARGLRSHQSNVIGLVTKEIATTPYAVGIIRGAQEAALDHGKTLLIVDADGRDDAVENALDKMEQWRAEGCIFATDYHREISLPGRMPRIPAVLVNCFSEDRVPAIVPDEVQGGVTATRALIAAGHRRIGFVNGPPDSTASAGRLQGYRNALAEAGLGFDDRLVRSGDWWQESGAQATAELLDLPDRPTALFCGNDWMAMGAYDIVKERGLSIPGDVAVIGFDNREEIAAHMRPALSTVALPYQDMGRRAVDCLLHGTESEPVRHLLPCPLVVRGSY